MMSEVRVVGVVDSATMLVGSRRGGSAGRVVVHRLARLRETFVRRVLETEKLQAFFQCLRTVLVSQ